jgi:two-component system invasion response regulator UvrY
MIFCYYFLVLAVPYPAKVFLIEKFPIVRAGLRLWLADTPDFTVVAEAATVREALLQIRTIEPNIVLLDINLPEKNGYDSLKALKAEKIDLRVLVIGNRPEEFYAMDMMNKGASGYFAIHGDANELVHIMRCVSRSDYGALKNEETSLPSLLHERLNAREYEVFYSLCCGDKPSDTARKLTLSLSMVSKYKKRVFAKIKVDNESQLIRYAVHHRIAGAFQN